MTRHPDTLLIHGREGVHAHAFGAHTLPIYQTASFVFPDVDTGAARFAGEDTAGYIYSRLGNPTVAAFEQAMAALEGSEAALGAASGMAAISAVLLRLLSNGDHIVATDSLYGCTHALITKTLARFGIESSFVDTSRGAILAQAIRPNTRIVYIETPANPTLRLTDLRLAADLAHQAGALLVVDNTFLSPILQRPLEHGADVVLHSATKYIGGHGDVIAGVICGSSDLMNDIRGTTLKDVGGVLAPFDAWLLVRGLMTLSLRMQRHCENAAAVAQFLNRHPKVAEVAFPGLEDFAQQDLMQRQMAGPGGMIAFTLKGGFAAGKALADHTRIARLAVSLGAPATLICHPASMTHSPMSPEERMAYGIGEGLLRLSVGLEDASDIIADLDQALSYA